MADIKTKYPSTSSTALTITLASLASGSAGVFTSGRQSDLVDNTSNNDLDHLLSGNIACGTSPTASRSINIFVFGNIGSSGGTALVPPYWGTNDANRTFSSANQMNAYVVLAKSILVDSTSDRDYSFGPISVASLFGGSLPKWWGVYVTHDTGVNLHSNSSNHYIRYERVQGQTV